MKIRLKTAIYKEYEIELTKSEIESYGSLEYAIDFLKKDYNQTEESKEITLQKIIIPEDQQDYDYLNSDDLRELEYKHEELKRELEADYESGLGIEDGKVAF